MKNPISTIRMFIRSLGPVEQAQVVASAAVVVTMTTIVSAIIVTGQQPRLMDFISILAVGMIGFISVYFSLHYSRQLDEQRRQVIALNTIAEAVTRVVDLQVVLQTALDRVTELLPTSTGWIYMLEEERLVLRCAKGTTVDFLALHDEPMRNPTLWLNQPRVEREQSGDDAGRIQPVLKELGIRFWASIPLRTMEGIAGALIVAGEEFGMFTTKQAELMEAFGNQINVGLNNALLFERLKASERQYADLFENSPDLYVNVNREYRIVDCNRTGADLLGFPKEVLIGRPLEALFVDDRRLAVRTMLEGMFSRGEALTDVEEQICGRDGHILNVFLNSTLLFDERGRAVNARIVARDITERKKMEGALLHAQKIDSIGNLAGGIAHDFNNLLAAILGSASIMRRKLAARSPLAKYVEIIESSARRGSSLTRQLLTFARKNDTLVEPVNVNALIEETLEMFRRSVTKEIDIRPLLTHEVAMVSGDGGQIQQAILNLLLNARDAMPDGGALSITSTIITADAHTTSGYSSVRPGPFVKIRIEDTGIGIPSHLHNRIFEPFYTTKDNGTGLGLSVVYGVVQTHGGFINMESTPGKGTSFEVYFPRATGRARTAGHGRRRVLPRGTERILIIDDEVSVSEIARDMLSGLGYTVDVASNGKEGVAFYRDRQASVDLILLDVNMPVMGGKEALHLLRRENPNVRIIIVTGYGKESIEASRLSNDVNGFIQKPFQTETLALKVRQVLDQSQVAQDVIS